METFCIYFVSCVFSIYICKMNLELNNLLEKVSNLYNRYGIRSITMDDVAQKLAISKKTLYKLFSDKSDLVEQVLLFELSNKRPNPGDLKNRNAIEDLFWVNKMINQTISDTNPSKEFDLQKYYPEIYKKIHDIKTKNIMKSMLANLRKGKKEELYRNDLDEDIIARMYLLRMHRIPHNEIITASEFTSSKFIYEMFVYHIRGIASTKGIAFLEKNIDKLLPEH